LEERYVVAGKETWVNTVKTPVRDKNGEIVGLLGIFRDITERKQAEEALQASETRFKTMFNGAPLGIALIDSLTGHIYSVNPMFSKIAGRSMEEMAHIDWMSITHPDDVQEDLDNMALLNAGKVPGFQMEKRYLLPDGTPVWINMTIAPIYVEDKAQPRHLCMIEDITERKEIEAGLEKTRQELAVIKMAADEVSELAENVINTVREPLIALDQDLRVVKVSSSFYEFFKVEPENTVGQLIYDLGNKQWDIPKLRELLETIIPQKATFDNYEVEHDFATIGKRTMLLNARQIQRVLGKERIILLAIEDITERKRAEDKLHGVLTELERSNKDLEQFASIASHDLQEPLRMVASYTQLLAERYENQLDEKAKKYIAYAVEGAIRMQRLVNDLLVYSRVSTRGNPLETTDSHSILGEAIRNLAAAIEESKAIVTNEELPMVRADASQIEQVFQNLLANAIKFRGENSPHIHVSVRDEGREWVFSVRDNGIGIERQYADRIFVIFQRLHTRQEYPGTGIGLAVCKRIVERHGGRIWFESVPGKGSTFFFTVPK
ncbi:MAG: PAS domain S-box protein, partial [Deltaproteobacteria bacterium]